MTSPGRYRLTLTADGQPMMHGWWNIRTVADRKLAGWVGEYGSLPGARITLVDEEAGRLLTAWPEEG